MGSRRKKSKENEMKGIGKHRKWKVGRGKEMERNGRKGREMEGEEKKWNKEKEGNVWTKERKGKVRKGKGTKGNGRKGTENMHNKGMKAN